MSKATTKILSAEITINFVTTETDKYTLPETNIAPENGWLEYYFPIGEAYV